MHTSPSSPSSGRRSLFLPARPPPPPSSPSLGLRASMRLKEGKITDVKVKGIEKLKPRGTLGSSVECYVIKGKNGKEMVFSKKDVLGAEIGKTSWELEKEHKEWYEKEVTKIK